MPIPTARDLAFSLKTFGGAMLALYIAFRLDLPQPGWAVLTAYIVSHPLAGAVLAKSLARVLGTIVGAIMATALVAIFADAREPFVLALAFWVGLCLYVSVLLRDAPASYGAMLAGYTAAIVGFPSVLSPLTAFDTAIARCTEITLGIACATLISRLVLPLPSRAALRRTLDASITAARAFATDVLDNRSGKAQGIADRRKLLADTMMLEVLRVQATFDPGASRDEDTIVRRLQARLLTLLAMLVSVMDRSRILARERPQRVAALAPLMARVGETVGGTADNPIPPEAIRQHLPRAQQMQQDADLAVEHILVNRMADVVSLDNDMRRLRDALDGGPLPAWDDGLPSVTRYRDHASALIAGLVAATSLCVTAAFWIVTGWSHGSTAAFLAAVVCSIMATLDDPAAGALNFLRMSVLSVIVAALYNFMVFPAIDGFPLLVFSLGLFLVPFGLFMPNPAIAPVILPLCLNVLALSGLKNTPGSDFADYLNGAISLLIGIGFSVGMFRLLRPLGLEWTVSRLLAGIRQDLAGLAAGRSQPEARSLFESRMFDRLNGLIARLGAQDESQRPTLQGALASLRVGLNIRWLRDIGPQLSPGLAVPVDQALRALAIHFRRPGHDLIQALDQAIAAIQAHGLTGEENATAALVALVGIRTSLTEHADFFSLAPAAGYSVTSPREATTP